MDEFLESVATHLSRARDASERVAIVAEFFAHVGDAERIRTAWRAPADSETSTTSLASISPAASSSA